MDVGPGLDTISLRDRADIVLDRLQVKVPYVAALITVKEASLSRQLTFVNRGLATGVVDHVLDDYVPRHPAFRLATAHPDRVFHWDNLPSFRTTYTARDVLMPHGYRQGTSMLLRDRTGAAVGTLHFSLEDSRFPDAGTEVLPRACAVIGEIVATHRRYVAASLSPRETEILCHMAGGLSNAEIAERLVVSRSTVGTHVEHILGKLGVRNRVQAALEAVAFGLVAPGSR